MNPTNHSQTAAFLWLIADLLRGDFKPSQYGRVILPFTLLRRLECVLEATKQTVLAAAKEHQTKPDLVREKLLLRAANQQFYNASPLSLGTLSDTQTADDLMSYVQSFSSDVREVFEHFHFDEFVRKLAANDLLYQLVQRFAAVDLSPDSIDNFGMGILFEELIRKFAESSNETGGEHFTPRDIVHLTTSLVITGQDDKLKPNSIVTIYDPTVGTGGFLAEGDEYIQTISKQVTVSLHGQELNPDSYAICKADMLIKGQTASNIKLGNTLSDDQFPGSRFDFMLSNPPWGVNWKNVQKQLDYEHKEHDFSGRFGPGLPRVSDGSLLFLLHLVSKMRAPREGGSRIGIILNGSPLFTGGAGSGESEIRRYLLQNDLVEAIVALPTDMFYNTGIAAYVWILSNHKPEPRRGQVQLIDGTGQFSKMRKSLGSKRQYLSKEQIAELVRLYGCFEETPQSKIFPIEAFGYRRITIERPLRLAFQVTEERIKAALAEKVVQRLAGAVQTHLITALQTLEDEPLCLSRASFSKLLKQALVVHDVDAPVAVLKALLTVFGERHPEAEICMTNDKPEPDSGLQDYENVPLGESIADYFEREVKSYVPDAWIDEDNRDALDGEVGVVGFEIPFNRILYSQQIKSLETQYHTYEEFSIKKLSAEINQIAHNETFTKKSNSLYIPKSGNSLAFTKAPEENSQYRYFQVVLKDLAINDYVSLFFRSDLGKLILESSMSGVTFKTLDRQSLERLTVALPSRTTQEQILKNHQKLKKLKEAMELFDSELSLNPTKSISVSEKLDDMLKVIGQLSESDKVLSLIRKGESKWLEFKETLNLDRRKQTKETYIATEALKTIVAFLNTEGGVLLIGVNDQGVVTGLNSEIEKDYKNSTDKFLQHFKNLIKGKIGEDFYPYIEHKIIEVNDELVLQVKCTRSSRPCFLNELDFYVRTNPASDRLEGYKLVSYIEKHFWSEGG